MKTTPIPADCQCCGACCFSLSPTYVRITGEDWARLGETAETVAHFVGNRDYMRMTAGHCASLEIHQDADAGVRYACSIYDRRPQVCRDLARGSPQCEAELARKTDRVIALKT